MQPPNDNHEQFPQEERLIPRRGVLKYVSLGLGSIAAWRAGKILEPSATAHALSTRQDNLAGTERDGTTSVLNSGTQRGNVPADSRQVSQTPPTDPLNAVNVKDYGALGDGKANDTGPIRAAIRAALDRAKTGGERPVYFPAGTYRIAESNIFSNLGDATHQGGIRFLGAGWQSSTLKLIAPAAESWFYNNRAKERMQLPTFSDLHFTCDLDNGSGKFANGFRIWSGGHEQGFHFHNCQFSNLNTLFRFDGRVGNDSHRLFGCRIWNIRNKVFHLNDSQAVVIELFGSNIEVVRDDIFYIGQGGGGDVRVYGGSIIMGRSDDPLEKDAYLLHVLGTGNVGPGNCTFVFDGVRTELHGAGAKLVQLRGNGGMVFAQFVGCNLSTASGGPREGVLVHQSNKQVLFERCRLPGIFSYRISGDRPGFNYGIPGRIAFNDCSLPRGIWQQVAWGSIHEDDEPGRRFGRFDVRGGFRERGPILSSIASISSDGKKVTVVTAGTHELSDGESVILQGTPNGTYDGITGPITLGKKDTWTSFSYSTMADGSPVPAAGTATGTGGVVKTQDYALDGSLNMPRTFSGVSSVGSVTSIALQQWPDSATAVGSGSEVILPPNAVIKSIFILKQSRKLGTSRYRLHVGTHDKATIYGSSSLGEQRAEHRIVIGSLMKPVGTDYNTRVVRLWADPAGESLGHVLNDDDHIIIEYF